MATRATRVSWRDEDDRQLERCIAQLGPENWREISKQLMEQCPETSFTPKQCKDRWFNHLDPNVKKGPFSEQEILQLYKYHQKYGNQWSKISRHLQGRTENDIKNKLNGIIRKYIKNYNRHRVGNERNLRTMKSLIRDRNITKQIMEFQGLEIEFEVELEDERRENPQIQEEEVREENPNPEDPSQSYQNYQLCQQYLHFYSFWYFSTFMNRYFRQIG